MATIASKENVNNQPCEFHQTNNLIYIYILMKRTWQRLPQENMYKFLHASSIRP
jgi:hypothetical protein